MQGFRRDVAGDDMRNMMQVMVREMESHMEKRRREKAEGPSGVQGSASDGDDEAEEGDVGNIRNVGVPKA